jgi:ATP-dependent RNA helicase RhlE
MRFEDLGLAEPLLRAVRAEGYEVATPIQTQAIPLIMAGKDLVGCAQTGTGKTAAFALPTIERLAQDRSRGNDRNRPIRALVLCPTRELALQIGQSFATYGKHAGLRHAVVFGGVGQMPQVRAIKAGLDVLIATPGRLLDLMNQGFVQLSGIEILILDEADRMLDMGFIHDLTRIVNKTPRDRQTLLFSATMPDAIRKLARQWLRNPVDVQVTPVASTVERIEQGLVYVPQKQKPALLAEWLGTTARQRTLVFTRTKHGADKVVKHLVKAGIPADAIHGNKSQTARQQALEKFKSNRPIVLVATDIAARGLDVDDVSHVVNFDIPLDPETYVHRIGRTGRAGASGMAISFCDGAEKVRVRAIEKLINQRIPSANIEVKLPAGFVESGEGDSARKPDQHRRSRRGNNKTRRDGRQGGQPSGQQSGHQSGRSARPAVAGAGSGPPKRARRPAGALGRA